MAVQHGRVATFSIDDAGGTPRDLSAFVNNASITLDGDTAEVTTLGSTGDAKEFIRGLNNGSLSISGFYDATATTGADTVLSGLYNAVAGTFSLSFDGGTVTYTGEALLTSYNPGADLGGAVSFNASFQITGVVTRS
jgi:predicted secreted protein